MIYQITRKNRTMNHPKTIEKYDGSLQELGRDIKNLEYDALVELLDILTQGF